MWAKKPGTMIRKVALVQALRESFPSSFGGVFNDEGAGDIMEMATEVYPVDEQEIQAIEQREPMPTMPEQTEEKEPVPMATANDDDAFFQ